MGIFSRKTPEPDPVPEDLLSGSFTVEMLAKRLLWDMVPCGDIDKVLPYTGMTPDSPEVREMEHRASHQRLNALVPMVELLNVLTPLVSAITSSAMLINSGNIADGVSASALEKHHFAVVQAGVVGTLATLLDLGIIKYTDGAEFVE